ncbi:MAG: septum formation protein Maf, partial [Actinobacteria bacterium]
MVRSMSSTVDHNHGMRPPRFVLASSSPRRAHILDQAGYRFESVSPEVDERPLPGESPASMVERVAAIKANAVADREAVVLGADTIVVLDGEILGKPADEEHAVETVLRLGGRSHVVLSGWAVLRGERLSSGIERTVVNMRPIDRASAVRYVASGEPLDKAGAYAIQGEGVELVAGYEGSLTNVMGLPMEALTPVLERFGVTPESP